MAYIELIIRVTRGDAEALSDALLEAGALSAAIEDADAGSDDEEPLFGEPGGEPAEAAWNHSIIVALFDEQADVDAIYTAACADAGTTSLPAPSRRKVADQDWVRLTQSQFEPIHVGERVWIVPSWHATPGAAIAQGDAVLLQLDPGLAFGTGSHPTTRLCLAWLEKNMRASASVIDYGCGSGILAIAAKLLGAGTVIGTDIDSHAVSASISNAEINDVEARFFEPDAFHAEPSEVVVANILSNPLKVLAPLLCDLVAPGGTLVLSGILERQWQEVAEVYAPMIKMDLWRVEDGWVCLVGSRARSTLPGRATRCPECETVFAYELEQIRGHGGQVRCGICHAVFNALDHSVDIDAFPPATAVPATTTSASDDLSMDADSKLVTPDLAGTSLPIETAQATAADLTASEAAPPGASPSRPVFGAANATLPGATNTSPGEASSAAPMETLAEPSFLRDSGAVAAARPERRRLLALLIVLLSLVGGAQALYIWRNDVAAQWPVLKPVMSEICQTFACQIEAPARIENLSIESAELQLLPQQRDAFAYVALLRNRGAIALRYPHVELTLLDAQNQPLVRRVLTPAQYLAPEQRATIRDGIAANSELPVRIDFELHGTHAIGFRSVLFYP